MFEKKKNKNVNQNLKIFDYFYGLLFKFIK
jgi:hypothetical protein